MIDHISVVAADIDRATAFFDAALAPLGASRLMSFEHDDLRVRGYGRDGKPSFWIAGRPGDSPQPMPGHVAFAALDRAAVDAFYRAAMAAGATDNGAPGLRPHYHENYYGAFVIDPDGNRLEAVCHRPE
jgi:catechol 2,3-dioxygenase-like lactoylglutathione lyase family enzyme